MSGRKNISFIKNDEPAFIKAFKQRTGYKEGPTIDSKRENLEYEEEDRADTEEEKPVVVVLKPGDLTAEEAVKLQNEQVTPASMGHLNEDEPPADGKITFKKPTKRQPEIDTDLNPSSVKKNKEEKKKKKSSCKEVKNSSLLSFDDEDDDT